MLKTTLRRVIGFALAAVMLFAAIGPAAAVGQTTGAASAYLHGGITHTTLPEQGWQDVVSFPDDSPEPQDVPRISESKRESAINLFIRRTSFHNTRAFSFAVFSCRNIQVSGALF